MGKSWVILVDQPKFKYQLGKANVVVDVLSRSRPHQMESQEIGHVAQRGVDKDLATLMTVQPSSAQLSTEEIKRFKKAQKTYDELREMFSQEEDSCRGRNLVYPLKRFCTVSRLIDG